MEAHYRRKDGEKMTITIIGPDAKQVALIISDVMSDNGRTWSKMQARTTDDGERKIEMTFSDP